MIQNKFKYCLLFLVFILNAETLIASDFQNKKQIDSLLKVITNDAYENPNKAINSALSIFENKTYPEKTRIRALMLVSLGYSSKRDYQKALEYVVIANELSTNLNDKILQIDILFMTGVLYQQLKIYDKSIEYMERIENMSLIYPVRDSVARPLANSYLVKGFIYKDNLNCDIALEFFNKALKVYSELKIPINHNASIAHYNKGNCYILLSEYENAKKSFHTSLEIAKLDNASSLISFAQKGLAEVFTLEGEYEKSISLLQTALDQSSNVGDIILNLGIYKGLFENYLALNQWDDYQKYYNLYLKTQIEIKISERNSISDSIIENTKVQNEALTSIDIKFQRKLKWSILFLVIIFICVLLFERKNKKTIKILKNKVKTLQPSKPLS